MVDFGRSRSILQDGAVLYIVRGRIGGEVNVSLRREEERLLPSPYSAVPGRLPLWYNDIREKSPMLVALEVRPEGEGVAPGGTSAPEL